MQSSEGPVYERRTDKDITVYRNNSTATGELLEVCKHFFRIFGTDETLYSDTKVLFPRFAFPTTTEFAEQANSLNVETRLRAGIIMCWFLRKSCLKLETSMKKRKHIASEKCNKYMKMLTKILSDLGWATITILQAESTRNQYLTRVAGYVALLIQEDVTSHNPVLFTK